jgi:hypothetical protein
MVGTHGKIGAVALLRKSGKREAWRGAQQGAPTYRQRIAKRSAKAEKTAKNGTGRGLGVNLA